MEVDLPACLLRSAGRSAASRQRVKNIRHTNQEAHPNQADCCATLPGALAVIGACPQGQSHKERNEKILHFNAFDNSENYSALSERVNKASTFRFHKIFHKTAHFALLSLNLGFCRPPRSGGAHYLTLSPSLVLCQSAAVCKQRALSKGRYEYDND